MSSHQHGVAPLTLAIALAVACASGAGERAAPGALPSTFDGCVAARGRVEPAARGGRCYLQLPKNRDAAAYAHCRDAGGLAHAAGPAGSLSGDSHVCTLVFDPQSRDEPGEDSSGL